MHSVIQQIFSWVAFQLFDSSYSNRWEVISCGFDLHFPEDYWRLSIFLFTSWAFISFFFFVNMALQVLCPLEKFGYLLFLLLSGRNSSYILDVDPLCINGLQIFLPFHLLPFRYFDCFLCCGVWCSPTSLFFWLLPVLLVWCPRSCCQD